MRGHTLTAGKRKGGGAAKGDQPCGCALSHARVTRNKSYMYGVNVPYNYFDTRNWAFYSPFGGGGAWVTKAASGDECLHKTGIIGMNC